MNKTVRLIGGPADGQLMAIEASIEYILVPIYPTHEPVDPNDVLDFKHIVGWDDYGPIRDYGYLQVRYKVDGDKAIYEEQTA